MRGTVLYFFMVVCLSCLNQVHSQVEVVNIIDASCVLSCFIKIFSIIHSSSKPQTLSFRFLVLDDLNFESLEKMYKGCFPEIRVQFKRWARPSTLPPLNNKGFNAEYIYSRIYLPDIFHEVDRYIYLDNDQVVNMDLSDLYYTPLVRATHPLTTRRKPPPNPIKGALMIAAHRDQERNRKHYRASSRQTSTTSEQPHRVTMGFVFDVNEKLRGYIQNGFNENSLLFKKAISYIEPAKFFNGGVALVDAKKWRSDNMTRKAEEIIRMNDNGKLYSLGLGDQGLFFLLLQDGIAELHPAFNMRRVPNKTTRFMKNNLGIVHFAGTTQGNARTICIDPLQYPVLSSGAVPLYLSIVNAFFNICPMIDNEHEADVWLSVRKTCLKAMNKTLLHQQEGKLHIDYLPGHSKLFAWGGRNAVAAS